MDSLDLQAGRRTARVKQDLEMLEEPVPPQYSSEPQLMAIIGLTHHTRRVILWCERRTGVADDAASQGAHPGEAAAR